MKKISRLAAFSALVASFTTPLIAVAAQTTGYSGINLNAITPYSGGIIYLINYILVPVLMAVAFIVFLWGVYRYFIQGAASDTERATGRQFVLWGVIGFVVILSLWGIVNLFMGTLGLSVGTAPPFPTIGGSVQPNTTGTVPIGTTGAPGAISAAQNAALASLQTKYTACQNSGNNPSTPQCQTYAQAWDTYNSAFGTANPYNYDELTCSDGTTKVADLADCPGSSTANPYNYDELTCPDGTTKVADLADCPSSSTAAPTCTDTNACGTLSDGSCDYSCYQ